MTDYGDESSYTLPWDMFDEESANSALDAARRCKSSSEDIVFPLSETDHLSVKSFKLDTSVCVRYNMQIVIRGGGCLCH